MRAELAELRARVIRLERRLDAAGSDAVPAEPSTQRSGAPGLLDAVADGLESLGAFQR